MARVYADCKECQGKGYVWIEYKTPAGAATEQKEPCFTCYERAMEDRAAEYGDDKQEWARGEG